MLSGHGCVSTRHNVNALRDSPVFYVGLVVFDFACVYLCCCCFFEVLLRVISLVWRLCMVAVWLSGSALVLINKVTVNQARLVLGWVTMSGVQLPSAENLSQYIASHPGHLSLAIPP